MCRRFVVGELLLGSVLLIWLATPVFAVATCIPALGPSVMGTPPGISSHELLSLAGYWRCPCGKSVFCYMGKVFGVRTVAGDFASKLRHLAARFYCAL